MGGLKAGAAAVDITPPLGIRMAGYFEERVARDVHDPLFAKALALDDGETTLVIVVCDLLGVKRERLDEAKRLIRERTGIPPSNVLICCTHTHTGPDVDDLGYPPSREGAREISATGSSSLGRSRTPRSWLSRGSSGRRSAWRGRRSLSRSGTGAST